MNGTPDLHGGDGFESRLLRALTEADARRPATAAAPARSPRLRRRRPAVLVAAVLLALAVAGGATTAAAIAFKPDRPDKVFPLGTKTVLKPGEWTGIKGMGCQPGSVVTVKLDKVTLGKTTAETDTSIPGVVGWFVARVTIPKSTAPGTHTLTATCPRPRGFGNYLKQDRVTITVVRS
jgi:hypothetical protein